MPETFFILQLCVITHAFRWILIYGRLLLGDELLDPLHHIVRRAFHQRSQELAQRVYLFIA